MTHKMALQKTSSSPDSTQSTGHFLYRHSHSLQNLTRQLWGCICTDEQILAPRKRKKKNLHHAGSDLPPPYGVITCRFAANWRRMPAYGTGSPLSLHVLWGSATFAVPPPCPAISPHYSIPRSVCLATFSPCCSCFVNLFFSFWFYYLIYILLL